MKVDKSKMNIISSMQGQEVDFIVTFSQQDIQNFTQCHKVFSKVSALLGRGFTAIYNSA